MPILPTGRDEPKRPPRRRTGAGPDKPVDERAAGRGGASGRPDRRREAEAPRRRVPAKISTGQAARCAARHVAELTGQQPEAVISVERDARGWLVGIEVLESRRIPDSMDILAEYRVAVGDDGELLSYRRTCRYYRGRCDEGCAP